MTEDEQYHRDTCDQQEQDELSNEEYQKEFKTWVAAMEKKYGVKFGGTLKEEQGNESE